MSRRKCKKKHPYILEFMKDSDQRIGSLVNQAVSITIGSEQFVFQDGTRYLFQDGSYFKRNKR